MTRASKPVAPIPDPSPDMLDDALAGIMSRDSVAVTFADGTAVTMPPAKQHPGAGRPTSYTPALAARLVEQIRLGKTPIELCNEDWTPHVAQFYRWRDEYPQFRDALARARIEGAEVMADRGLQCIDASDIENKNAILKATRQAEMRMRLAAVYDKRFAERQIVAHENQEPSNAKDLGTANLAQLAQQLAKLLTQAGAIDVESQPVDVPQVSDKTGKSG